MSYEYDQYLIRHRCNVQKAYYWLSTNLPEVVGDYDRDVIWQVVFTHDISKDDPEEYEAYDAYFYGNNRSHEVVTAYQRAWLRHIQRNEHHWQHWVLINDDPAEGTVALEMPHNYILGMICDWWSFSIEKENLEEIFDWYAEHKDYMLLAPKTRETVEDILSKLAKRLGRAERFDELMHHGIKGQKWGVKNGPPYPLTKSDSHDTIIKNAIASGEVSTTINREKQLRHTKDEHAPGRSYLNGDVEYAQKLVDKLHGTGEAKVDSNGNWTRKEMVADDEIIGTHVDPVNGIETRTNKATIVYSKTGTHIYPRLEE